MFSLRERMFDESAFLIGVELVSTRGILAERQAARTREFASQLGRSKGVDWVSITDNAGGNPMLSPVVLGTPLLYGGKEVVIHLSCKDFNRNGLEREAWLLASQGFHNILALSGDYPARGYRGGGKPVFDIDSVGLLTLLSEMNEGLAVERNSGSRNDMRRLRQTQFFPGAVTTNFKLHENEVMPQYLKLEKKIAAGARFIIAQVGYDARKSSELIAYLAKSGCGQAPLIGNVFMLTPRAARFFHKGNIPGVVISEELLEACERYGKSPDRGRAFFVELAAKQVAIFRGLGFRGAYLGGVETTQDIADILELEASFHPDDWKQFAPQIRYSQPGEFFYFAEDPKTGLADAKRLAPAYEASLRVRPKSHNVTLGYRLSRWAHDAFFSPGTKFFERARRVYAAAPDPEQGPVGLRIIEKVSKALLYECKDCGDCSLPETAFLCPESQCAKNQRNGPCGGTRQGRCEVEDFECIWARAYDRLKYEGRELQLLDHAPVIQDQALRGTSSWANTYLGRDHHGRGAPQRLDEGRETQGQKRQPKCKEDEHPGQGLDAGGPERQIHPGTSAQESRPKPSVRRRDLSSTPRAADE